jgi:putative peptide zinc metalloprotease protein
MNLSQVLQTALPELPPQLSVDVLPRLHPRLIAREHIEREGPVVVCVIPGGAAHFFRLTRLQYQLVQLFDGKRSYNEVATLFSQQGGMELTAQQTKDFADSLEKVDFWYRTPQEESAVLAHQLVEERHKFIKRKKAHVDLATIEIIYFNPDKYLTWAYRKLKFMYSNWFFVWSLFMFLVMGTILGSHWREVWADSVYFYNLTGQGIGHVFEFFGVFLVLGAIHETAHGVTCKHFGGRSHRMGFFTMYLAPGVFCDVAEVFVYGGRWARIATVAAGVWSEIILCSYLSVVWWLTPAGSTVHNLAYMIILSGGIFAVLINWNPLSRMDGYFILSEALRFFDLKGQSTAYLVGLVRKHMFRLPATIPAMPPLRRVGFVTYALLSGLYCYSLLLFFVRVLYHVSYFYSPLWAFLPAALLAFLIFKGRIRKLAAFVKELYLDKRELMRAHWNWMTAGAVVGAVLLLAPLRHDFVEQRFVLEPIQRAVIRAQVPGRVMQVEAGEGDLVRAGDAIVRMRDLALESQAAEAETQYRVALSRATEAQLRYADFGAADQQRRQLQERFQTLREQQEKLDIVSPIAGRVITPRVRDLAGSYVVAGTEIAEVVDTSAMKARVYVPEPEFQKLKEVTGSTLRLDARWSSMAGQVVAISPTSRELAPGLEPPPKYQGMHVPVYFVVDVLIPNRDGQLRDGMTGTAKIYGGRQSVAGSVLRPVVDAVSRRLW